MESARHRLSLSRRTKTARGGHSLAPQRSLSLPILGSVGLPPVGRHNSAPFMDEADQEDGTLDEGFEGHTQHTQPTGRTHLRGYTGSYSYNHAQKKSVKVMLSQGKSQDRGQGQGQSHSEGQSKIRGGYDKLRELSNNFESYSMCHCDYDDDEEVTHTPLTPHTVRTAHTSRIPLTASPRSTTRSRGKGEKDATENKDSREGREGREKNNSWISSLRGANGSSSSRGRDYSAERSSSNPNRNISASRIIRNSVHRHRNRDSLLPTRPPFSLLMGPSGSGGHSAESFRVRRKFESGERDQDAKQSNCSITVIPKISTIPILDYSPLWLGLRPIVCDVLTTHYLLFFYDLLLSLIFRVPAGPQRPLLWLGQPEGSVSGPPAQRSQRDERPTRSQELQQQQQ